MKNKQTKKSGFVKKSVVVVIIVLLSFSGYKYLSAKKQMGQRQAAFETQRQVMIEFWEEQGLSDEEIQLKLKDLRQEKIESGEGSSGIGIMRLFGGRRSPGR